MQRMWRSVVAVMLVLVAACGGGDNDGSVLGEECSAGPGKGWCWQHPLPIPRWINEVAFADPQKGWAAGAAGYLLRSVDGGASWIRQQVPTEDDLLTIRAVDGDRAWAVTSKGQLLHTRDGGAQWRLAGMVPLGRTYFFWIHDDQTLFANGEFGSVDGRPVESNVTVLSRDGGASWERVPYGFRLLDDVGAAWAVDWTGLRVWRSGDAEPAQVFACRYPCVMAGGFLQDATSQVVFTSNSGTYWLDGSSLVRHSSRDGGRTWTSTALALSPTQEEGSPFNVGPFDRAGRGWAYSHRFVTDAVGHYSPELQTLWRTADAGLSWQPVSIPPGQAVGDPWFLDAQSASLSVDGLTYLTLDAGRNWKPLVMPGDRPFGSSLRKYEAAAGVLVAQSGGTQWYTSRDPGQTWTVLPGAYIQTTISFSSPHFFDERNGIVTAGPELLRTADGGRSWKAVVLPEAKYYTVSLQFPSDAAGWVIGDDWLYRSEDRGLTWKRVPGAPRMRRASFVDGRTGWGIASPCSYEEGASCATYLYGTSDGGASWQMLGQISAYLDSIVQAIDEHHLVMTSDAGIRHSSDGGRTWTPAVGVPDGAHRGNFHFARGASNGWFFVSSWDTRLFGTRDVGRSWTEFALPTDIGSVYGLSFSDPLNGWLAGSQGIARTADGGQTWRRQSRASGASLSGVFALDPQHVWVTGNAILATETGGE